MRKTRIITPLPPPATDQETAQHKEWKRLYGTIHAVLEDTVYDDTAQMAHHHCIRDED
ncbi:hypothetical protein IscW_ISCW001065 [Ixodes scapularis]|uniref:Uncharacterized protein n=1 Tax=Ixodes scapularis TaxID=6945 RepID=B7P497_IXOSC|nr:hypothetical protein IscW_ISCW001065 [Ixodes scapularis]|eukprot:XP_002405680.1 hypothetical protein IscW_ISCW001065 [Ixodes scapularis]